MTAFQIVGVATAVLMAVFTVATLARRRRQLRQRLALAVVWLAAGAAILWPDVSMRLANAVGIGRGADLLLYVAILVALVVVFLIYLRFLTLENQLTELVRHIAMSEARRSSTGSAETDETVRPPD